jgi:acyl carrier protein
MVKSAAGALHYKNIKEKKENKTMLEKMKEMIADQLGIDAEEVTPDKALKEDLNADSLDLFELVTNLEDEYEIEIPAEDLETMVTVQDVLDYLKNKGIEE